MVLSRRALLVAGAVTLPVAAGAGAYTFLNRLEEEEARPVFSENGIAIRGTDPVAYFTEGRPVAGSQAHILDWNGAIWRFASAENLAAFRAEPTRYAPQYGGFCAWAVATKGKLYSTQPANWRIVDDKLYLNFNDSVQATWETDIPGFIQEADRRWPEIVTA